MCLGSSVRLLTVVVVSSSYAPSLPWCLLCEKGARWRRCHLPRGWLFAGPRPDRGACVLPDGERGPSSGERVGTGAYALLPSLSLPVMPSRARRGHLPGAWRGWGYRCPQLPSGCLKNQRPLASLLMLFRDAPTPSPAFSPFEETIISFPTENFCVCCGFWGFFLSTDFFPHKFGLLSVDEDLYPHSLSKKKKK